MKEVKDLQNIEFTKQQFLTLLKIIYLGDWMVNSHRTGHGNDPMMEDYEEIMDYVFSLAPKFGFSKNIEHELEFDDSGKMTEINKLQEEYNEETFWEELCERLGERDFHEKYSPNEILKMDRDERYDKLYECIEVYEDEAENFGIERIKILKTIKDFGL